MKIIYDLPPNWDEIKKHFPAARWGKTIVTYGQCVHTSRPLSEDLLVHEAVHAEQQLDPAAWWKRYFEDAEFRLSQEVPAYKAQFRFLKTAVKDRNRLFLMRDRLARGLCGPLYGNMISYREAFNIINT